jgi:putative membrane protein insertion efficiency factor
MADLPSKDYDHFPTPEELRQDFGPAPSSFERPPVHWGRLCLQTFLPLLIALGLGFALFYGSRPSLSFYPALGLASGGSASLLLLYVNLRLKAIIIALVQIYQHYASDETRGRCVFTPTCSQYMILAVQKYGAYRGLWKGLDRLRRCHVGNGGVDNP